MDIIYKHFPYPKVKTEDNLDCIIDLEAEPTYVDGIQRWYNDMSQRIHRSAQFGNEKFVDEMMVTYYRSLKERTISNKDKFLFKDKVLTHIKYFHSYYKEIEHSLVDTNYFSRMEDILTYYCSLELELVHNLSKQRENKRRFVIIVKRLCKVLGIYLHHKLKHIFHVLLKMNYNTRNPACHMVMRKLFLHFLMSLPPEPLSDEVFCRYYLLFQRCKAVAKPEEKEKLDEFVFAKFGKTKEFLSTNKLMKTVLSPSCDTITDIVHHLLDFKETMITSYFNYLKDSQVNEISRLRTNIDPQCGSGDFSKTYEDVLCTFSDATISSIDDGVEPLWVESDSEVEALEEEGTMVLSDDDDIAEIIYREKDIKSIHRTKKKKFSFSTTDVINLDSDDEVESVPDNTSTVCDLVEKSTPSSDGALASTSPLVVTTPVMLPSLEHTTTSASISSNSTLASMSSSAVTTAVTLPSLAHATSTSSDITLTSASSLPVTSVAILPNLEHTTFTSSLVNTPSTSLSTTLESNAKSSKSNFAPLIVPEIIGFTTSKSFSTSANKEVLHTTEIQHLNLFQMSSAVTSISSLSVSPSLPQNISSAPCQTSCVIEPMHLAKSLDVSKPLLSSPIADVSAFEMRQPTEVLMGMKKSTNESSVNKSKQQISTEYRITSSIPSLVTRQLSGPIKTPSLFNTMTTSPCLPQRLFQNVEEKVHQISETETFPAQTLLSMSKLKISEETNSSMIQIPFTESSKKMSFTETTLSLKESQIENQSSVTLESLNLLQKPTCTTQSDSEKMPSPISHATSKESQELSEKMCISGELLVFPSNESQATLPLSTNSKTMLISSKETSQASSFLGQILSTYVPPSIQESKSPLKEEIHSQLENTVNVLSEKLDPIPIGSFNETLKNMPLITTGLSTLSSSQQICQVALPLQPLPSQNTCLSVAANEAALDNVKLTVASGMSVQPQISFTPSVQRMSPKATLHNLETEAFSPVISSAEITSLVQTLPSTAIISTHLVTSGTQTTLASYTLPSTSSSILPNNFQSMLFTAPILTASSRTPVVSNSLLSASDLPSKHFLSLSAKQLTPYSLIPPSVHRTTANIQSEEKHSLSSINTHTLETVPLLPTFRPAETSLVQTLSSTPIISTHLKTSDNQMTLTSHASAVSTSSTSTHMESSNNQVTVTPASLLSVPNLSSKHIVTTLSSKELPFQCLSSSGNKPLVQKISETQLEATLPFALTVSSNEIESSVEAFTSTSIPSFEGCESSSKFILQSSILSPKVRNPDDEMLRNKVEMKAPLEQSSTSVVLDVSVTSTSISVTASSCISQTNTASEVSLASSITEMNIPSSETKGYDLDCPSNEIVSTLPFSTPKLHDSSDMLFRTMCSTSCLILSASKCECVNHANCLDPDCNMCGCNCCRQKHNCRANIFKASSESVSYKFGIITPPSDPRSDENLPDLEDFDDNISNSEQEIESTRGVSNMNSNLKNLFDLNQTNECLRTDIDIADKNTNTSNSSLKNIVIEKVETVCNKDISISFGEMESDNVKYNSIPQRDDGYADSGQIYLRNHFSESDDLHSNHTHSDNDCNTDSDALEQSFEVEETVVQAIPPTILSTSYDNILNGATNSSNNLVFEETDKTEEENEYEGNTSSTESVDPHLEMEYFRYDNFHKLTEQSPKKEKVGNRNFSKSKTMSKNRSTRWKEISGLHGSKSSKRYNQNNKNNKSQKILYTSDVIKDTFDNFSKLENIYNHLVGANDNNELDRILSGPVSDMNGFDTSNSQYYENSDGNFNLFGYANSVPPLFGDVSKNLITSDKTEIDSPAYNEMDSDDFRDYMKNEFRYKNAFESAAEPVKSLNSDSGHTSGKCGVTFNDVVDTRFITPTYRTRKSHRLNHKKLKAVIRDRIKCFIDPYDEKLNMMTKVVLNKVSDNELLNKYKVTNHNTLRSCIRKKIDCSITTNCVPNMQSDIMSKGSSSYDDLHENIREATVKGRKRVMNGQNSSPRRRGRPRKMSIEEEEQTYVPKKRRKNTKKGAVNTT